MSEYKFQRSERWPEDLVLTELPSLEEIVENPEWWYNLTTNGGKTFPRDIYLGEDKQTMVLFHGGGVFEEFDPRYWGRGEGSTRTVLVPKGRLSASTNVSQAIYYCSFPLRRKCPAALYMLLVNRDFVAGEGGTEIMIDYANSAHIEIVDRVMIERDDILDNFHAYGKGNTSDIESLPRTQINKQTAIDNGIRNIVDTIFCTKELKYYNFPYESLWDETRAQVLDLVASKFQLISIYVKEMSNIAESAIVQMLHVIESTEYPDPEEEPEYLRNYYLQFVEEGTWASIMQNLFRVLSYTTEDVEHSLIFSVAVEYVRGVRVNLNLIKRFGSLEDPFAREHAFPEDPLQIECLSPSALVSNFNKRQREQGFVSLDYALDNPEVDVIFPKASSQELRCTYWKTAGMDKNFIRLDLRDLQRIIPLLMRDFR